MATVETLFCADCGQAWSDHCHIRDREHRCTKLVRDHRYGPARPDTEAR